MVWSATSPDGALSVAANTPIMAANTTYTQTTMNVDHYWNIGVDEDGHHKQVQMPVSSADITLGTGMNGGLYLRTVSASNARIEGFYRNVNGVFQFIPSFVTGSLSVSSSYGTVAAVAANSYGQIFMYKADNSDNGQLGFFKSGTATVQTYTVTTQFSGSSTAKANLKFGNGSEASGLNIRVRTQEASSGTYQYRIMYWGS